MTCYALAASDQPLQIRYVGSTTRTLRERLIAHLRDKASGKRRICFIRHVLMRGERVLIVPLSTHTEIFDMFMAESAWIKFWGKYCDLTNTPRAISIPALSRNPHPNRALDTERIRWPHGGDMSIQQSRFKPDGSLPS